MSNGLKKPPARSIAHYIKELPLSGAKCGSCGVAETSCILNISKCGHKSCSPCLIKRYIEGYHSCPKCSLKLHKCSSCEAREVEENLNLCITCKPIDCKSKTDLVEMALCSNCALKQHVRKNHEVVDFFPYWSAYQFETKLKFIQTKQKKYSAAGELFHEKVQKFLDLTKNANTIYESSIYMLRGSRSSKNQVELAGKIEEFLRKAEEINKSVNEKLEGSIETLKKQVDCLQNAYSDESKYNVNEKEIIKLSPEIIEGLEAACMIS